MKKRYIFLILAVLVIKEIPVQGSSFNFEHRVTISSFNSYRDDNIGILEAGYDFIIPLLKINPAYNVFDTGIGVSCIYAFDNTGNPREPTIGFGLNGSARIYTPSIKNASLFLEGVISFVVYTKEYPENGSILNGGWHLGGGWQYKTSAGTKIFSTIRWFHTSNNDIYGRDRNPSVNAIGLSLGVQL